MKEGSLFELDHLFVCSGVNAPEAQRLLDLGLVEGKRNTHRGQGTANRRFFFHNAMLELLWVHDEAEARSEATRRTRIFERWQARKAGASPFGFCVRPAARGDELEEGAEEPPFAGWPYRPAYVPPGLAIHVGGNSDKLDEPMLFELPFATRPDRAEASRRQPLDHPADLREITRVTWIGPAARNPSPELLAMARHGCLSLRAGASEALEVGFDGETRGKRCDLRPDLPVALHW